MSMLKIGKSINKLRRENSISQNKLSKLPNISLNLVVKIQLDHSQTLPLKRGKNLSKFLVVSFDYLVNA